MGRWTAGGIFFGGGNACEQACNLRLKRMKATAPPAKVGGGAYRYSINGIDVEHSSRRLTLHMSGRSSLAGDAFALIAEKDPEQKF
jgi:hypothetical protein